mmetsp:Transcript_9114/g.23868  ORF Transcript_9114/g.23868 Transcript_9114/m.23868 type:complete len:257 (+) Transcript_9114:763-1533(+)
MRRQTASWLHWASRPSPPSLARRPPSSTNFRRRRPPWCRLRLRRPACAPAPATTRWPMLSREYATTAALATPTRSLGYARSDPTAPTAARATSASIARASARSATTCSVRMSRETRACSPNTRTMPAISTATTGSAATTAECAHTRRSRRPASPFKTRHRSTTRPSRRPAASLCVAARGGMALSTGAPAPSQTTLALAARVSCRWHSPSTSAPCGRSSTRNLPRTFSSRSCSTRCSGATHGCHRRPVQVPSRACSP